MTAEPVPTSTPPPKERMTAPWATSDPSPSRAAPNTTADPAICNEPALASLSALPGPPLIVSIMRSVGEIVPHLLVEQSAVGVDVGVHGRALGARALLRVLREQIGERETNRGEYVLDRAAGVAVDEHATVATFADT